MHKQRHDMAPGMSLLVALWTLAVPCISVTHNVARLTSDGELEPSSLRGFASAKLENCNEASPEEVVKLKSLQWPRPDVGTAPRIAKLVYINLDESRDRRDFMERQFTELKGNGSVFQPIRFPALTIKQVQTESQFEPWRKRGFNPSMEKNSWGTAANMLSHFEAVRLYSGNSSDLAMILEDDVVITPHFDQLWSKLWPYVPDDWDVLRVGAFLNGARSCAQKVNEHVDRADWADPPPREPGGSSGPCRYCGTQALIVRPASVLKVLQRLKASRFMHTDTAFGADTPPYEDRASNPPLKVFELRPFLVQHAEDVIHTDDGILLFPSVRDDVDEREAASTRI
jgi:GR25 family glycosyltransferase involved in LPS biosynthesis